PSQAATVTATTVPPETQIIEQLPAATLARPAEAAVASEQVREQQPRTVDESQAAFWLRESRRAAAEGKPDYAGTFLWQYGNALLTGDPARALAAFAQGEAQYPDARSAALCAWSQVVALRRLHREIDSN